jgi:hypothetical protein
VGPDFKGPFNIKIKFDRIGEEFWEGSMNIKPVRFTAGSRGNKDRF